MSDQGIMVEAFELMIEIADFCRSGVGDPELPHVLPRLGCGNSLTVGLVVAAVMDVLQDRDKRAVAKGRRDTVPELIADHAVLTMSSDYSWKRVCSIIDTAGSSGLQQHVIDDMLEKYPRAAPTLRNNPFFTERTVKRAVKDLAVAIIWAQAMSFMERKWLLNALH